MDVFYAVQVQVAWLFSLQQGLHCARFGCIAPGFVDAVVDYMRADVYEISLIANELQKELNQKYYPGCYSYGSTCRYELAFAGMIGEIVMKKPLLFLIVLTAVFSGCATREYVHEYVQNQLNPVNSRANALDGRLKGAESGMEAGAAKQRQTDAAIAEVQVTMKVHADRLARNEADIAQLSKTAQEALQRAGAAGELAAGKMSYEVVLSDDKLKFATGKAELGGVAEASLDEFIAQLKQDNRGVYIEVQGHTDSIGSVAGNMKLGAARAEAVKRYLSIHGGIPLHRISTISYGESEPVADNRYKAGRTTNRRVVLVVIQ